MAVMTRSLINRIRATGTVVNEEIHDWESRGESDGGFNIKGILLHHDGMGLGNSNVAHNMSNNGTDGAQLWISKAGQVYPLAAGRKWHAGLGGPWHSIPRDDGNTWLIGIETDHTDGQIWTYAQSLAIKITSLCIVQEYGIDVDNWCCGHREYTGPQSDCPGRKPDPENFDLNAWRAFMKTAPIPVPPIVKEWYDMATQKDLTDVVNAGPVLKFVQAITAGKAHGAVYVVGPNTFSGVKNPDEYHALVGAGLCQDRVYFLENDAFASLAAVMGRVVAS